MAPQSSALLLFSGNAALLINGCLVKHSQTAPSFSLASPWSVSHICFKRMPPSASFFSLALRTLLRGADNFSGATTLFNGAKNKSITDYHSTAQSISPVSLYVEQLPSRLSLWRRCCSHQRLLFKTLFLALFVSPKSLKESRSQIAARLSPPRCCCYTSALLDKNRKKTPATRRYLWSYFRPRLLQSSSSHVFQT